MVTECRLVAAWGGVWRERQERGITKGHKETLGCDKYVHYLDRVDGFMGVYVKTYQIVLLKYS